MPEQLELSLPTEEPKARRGIGIAERARRFDEANPHVFRIFCDLTYPLIDAARQRGQRPRVGAKMVFEVMRYQHLKSTREVNGGKRFLLNNNYTAYYARKFHRLHPHLGQVFETREVEA